MPSPIPANPDMAAMVAAATLGASQAAPPTHQPNTLIPGLNSPVTVSHTPQPVRVTSSQEDWFSSAGTDEPQAPSAPPAPPSQQAPQLPDDFAGINELLQDLPQTGVPEPQQFRQEPITPSAPVVPAAVAPPAFDADAAQKLAIDTLMGREYAIPEADARRLISEPEQVLPRLAATVHVNAVKDIGRMVAQQLPAMIAAGVQQHLQSHRAEMEFFGKFPQLNRPEFRPTVERAISMTRQMNPSADRDTVMREGAVLAANLIRSGHRARGNVPAPPQRSGVVPYSPATPNGGVQVPMNPQRSNAFTDLGNDPTLFDF